MNVVGVKNVALPKSEEVTSSAPKGIEHIHLYDEAPVVEMSLDQFEIYALKRLKVGSLN